MKKLLLFVITFACIGNIYGQEEEEDKPERDAFEAPILIDNHTVVTPFKGGFEYEIHHRFGTVENGIDDLFGIYAPSNIRMGLNYGITDDIMVGFGTTKDSKLQDLQWKYTFLRQTRSKRIPVTLSYYGNVVLDATSSDNFGPEEDFKPIHRLSYLNQLIIAHRFNFRYSLQVAPSFIYYNAVQQGMKNANFGLHAGGRAKLFGSYSFIAEYDQLLTSQEEGFEPKPNLAFGIEIGTATHAFQIFAANYAGIIGQRNFMFNTNDFTEGEFLLGFNITVRF